MPLIMLPITGMYHANRIHLSRNIKRNVDYLKYIFYIRAGVYSVFLPYALIF